MSHAFIDTPSIAFRVLQLDVIILVLPTNWNSLPLLYLAVYRGFFFYGLYDAIDASTQFPKFGPAPYNYAICLILHINWNFQSHSVIKITSTIFRRSLKGIALNYCLAPKIYSIGSMIIRLKLRCVAFKQQHI